MSAAPPRLRATLPGLVVALLVIAAAATLALVAAGGRGGASSRAQRVQQIAAGLHCPICKDLSVADSPAPLAQQMRREIAQKLRAGQTPHEIRAAFVAAYGDTVLMSPPRHGLAQTAYYLPFAVVGCGLALGVLLLRRWRRAPEPEPSRDEPQLSAAQRRALDRALDRLREEEPG
jgi:cytochrome c-type biogenesis protein CcmH